MKKSKGNSDVYIKNKRASYEYEFLDKYTAGIVLTGTEIKSIRAGKASLSDSYCYFINNELFVRSMHISDYWWASAFSNHEPKRDRKLLLNKRELRKLQRATKEKGLTITTISLFINEKG